MRARAGLSIVPLLLTALLLGGASGPAGATAAPAAAGLPRQFVIENVEAHASLEVRSTATGALVRTLGQVPARATLTELTLAPDGRTAYAISSAGLVSKLVQYTPAGIKQLAPAEDVALSPDGTELAYVQSASAGSVLKVRTLASGQTRSLALSSIELGTSGETPIAWTGAAQLTLLLRPTDAPSSAPGHGCSPSLASVTCLATVNVPPTGALAPGSVAARLPAGSSVARPETAFDAAGSDPAAPNGVLVGVIAGRGSATAQLDRITPGPDGAGVQQIASFRGEIDAIAGGEVLLERGDSGLLLAHVSGDHLAVVRTVLPNRPDTTAVNAGW